MLLCCGQLLIGEDIISARCLASSTKTKAETSASVSVRHLIQDYNSALAEKHGPDQTLAEMIYVRFIDSVFTDKRSHLLSFSFVFPALKSPAAFHEQRKSLERSKVRRTKQRYSKESFTTKVTQHTPSTRNHSATTEISFTEKLSFSDINTS